MSCSCVPCVSGCAFGETEKETALRLALEDLVSIALQVVNSSLADPRDMQSAIAVAQTVLEVHR